MTRREALTAAPEATPRDDEPHDKDQARRGRCDCRACRRAAFHLQTNTWLIEAESRLNAAALAMRDFADHHCDQRCGVCLTADAAAGVLANAHGWINGEIIPGHTVEPAARPANRDRAEWTMIAMWDAIDATLDLIVGHPCGGREACDACAYADEAAGVLRMLAYHFQTLGVDSPAASDRTRLSSVREGARAVAAVAFGVDLGPHAADVHALHLRTLRERGMTRLRRRKVRS